MMTKLWFWERPYYWEYVGVDASDIPRWQRSWHLTRWAGQKLINGVSTKYPRLTHF
jgi:hypothetical protein